ncbi:hypothetical protein [Labrenzia sp. DG1229]|uniref:hypothetical protein n=1 Tax=Labrenzia sp. DG1229 TaxID=681847 RepID=UPI000692300D|nr:hypothetical protein [Labrenzia sp. DG1229]
MAMKLRKHKMMSLAQAEREFPLGTKVRYFPLAGSKNYSDHTIRSQPWELGHGQVVVLITFKSGCVAVEHLQKV